MLKSLAFSNLAWALHDETKVFAELRDAGIRRLELAPTKIFGFPLPRDRERIRTARTRFEDAGFEIVSAQSLLFGHPDLQLFREGDSGRRALLDYLRFVIEVCADLGATQLVFGSPKHRQRGALPEADALVIAEEFFRKAGDLAQASGTVLALEGNSRAYGCDFLLTTPEVAAFVQQVQHPAVRLHLDTGNMLLEKENVESVLRQFGSTATHCQISAPQLRPIGSLDHSLGLTKRLGEVLSEAGYRGSVAVEMLMDQQNSKLALEQLREALAWLQEYV